MKNIFRDFISIGVRPDYDYGLIRRVKISNAVALLWYFAFGLTIFISIGVRDNYYDIVYTNLIGFVIIVGCQVLNKLGKHNAVALGIMLFTIMYYLLLCCFIRPERFVEFFYVFIPSFSLVLSDNKYIHWFSLIVCVISFHIPFLVFDYYQYEDVLFLPPLMIFLFFVNFTVVYYFKQLNQNNEAKLEVAYKALEETKKTELAHLQLKSLKAQMNPHFMFNAMNSIQGLILKGDKHEAYQYLSKFSTMIRENLNMSEKSFVSFEEELALLTNYLELEKLRFREGFHYELIGVSTIEDINIPSMIIQPFAENSIKHGLFQKITKNKNLTIEFEQKDVFKCTITDNGIGIEQSKAIELENDNDKESFSTNAIIDRLTLLKDYYKMDIGVEYIPVDVGTKVVINIPYTLNEE